MSSDGETRAGAQTADSSAAADAWTEREARMGADVASMQAGNAPGHAEQLTHHDGLPSPATQMASHGMPAPRTPDEGGHQSASDRIG